MASLRKRGNYYFIDYRINGKRVRKHIGESKEEAQRTLKEIEEQLAKGQLAVVDKSSSLENLFLQFQAYCQSNLAYRTQIRYNAIITNFTRFLSEAFSSLTKIPHLTPQTFHQFIETRRNDGAKDRTINAELIVLRMMFRLAVRWSFMNRNPLEDFEFIDVAPKDDPRFLTVQECQKLLLQADEWFYPILYTFLYTGMRKGELENLHWDDIDFQARKIKIIAREGFVKHESEREFPISQGLLEVLQKLKNQGTNNPYVFTHKGNKKIPENYLRKRLMMLTHDCGFADVTQIQSLRYTFGAQLVKKGLDLANVRVLMGHSDKDTALLYGQFAQKRTDSIIEELDF